MAVQISHPVPSLGIKFPYRAHLHGDDYHRIGRKSGKPRRTAIEFHEFKGRKYVFGNWGEKADWYRKIEAQPNITIQTWRGAESVTARKIVTDSELAEAFEYSMSNPSMRMVLKAIGFELNLEQFIAHKDRFTFVTFDPTDQPSPRSRQICGGCG